MRRLFAILILFASLSATIMADDIQGRVLKTLPLFLDLKGRDSVSPSLFDRDAYQFYLRQHTNEISAIRYDVLWKASNAQNAKLKLRIELQGVGTNGLPRQAVLEKEVAQKFFRSWTSFTLDGGDYKNFSAVNAWRTTLWSGDKMIGEQKSFLW